MGKSKNAQQQFRKQEKRKLQKKSREVAKRNRANELLLKDYRRLEQEFQELISNGMKSSFPSKLNEINDVRLKLGLPTKTLADYDLKRKGESSKASIKEPINYHEMNKQILETTEKFEFTDLSNIPIPEGEAPETEGQIFNSLTQLQLFSCSSSKKKSVPPPPPPRISTFKDLPIPTYIPKIDEAPTIYPSTHEHTQQSQATSKPIIRAATIVQAPVMRDLQKELIGMVPVALKRKREQGE